MMNIYGAEKILKRRDKLNSALEKERGNTQLTYK